METPSIPRPLTVRKVGEKVCPADRERRVTVSCVQRERFTIVGGEMASIQHLPQLLPKLELFLERMHLHPLAV
jgi:hypothetical protein